MNGRSRLAAIINTSKRELGLQFEDYTVCARLGDSPVDLTYDRGVTAIADLADFSSRTGGSMVTHPQPCALEFNFQYLHREDDRPTFAIGEPRAKLDGGFGEVLLRPAGSRWYGFALYNLVTTNRPVLNVRLGGPPNVDRYETVSVGVGRLIQRNLRVTTELTYDIEQEEGRWTLGFVTAF